jgi:hypothetical protein
LAIVRRLQWAGTSDAGEQDRSWFVTAPFAACEFGFGRHEFAPECFGEDGLRQLLGASGCGGDALLDGVGQLKQSLDATDDLFLFFEWRQRNIKTRKQIRVETCSRGTYGGFFGLPSNVGCALKDKL